MNARDAERLAKNLDLFRAASFKREVHADAQPEFFAETQKFARVIRENGITVGSIAGAKTHNLVWRLVETHDRDGIVADETYLSVLPACGTTRSSGTGGHYQNYNQVARAAQPTCAKCAKNGKR
jgi:hypothetical protein